jgi:glycosyltransferase involved in cell wall biosynthesis
MLEELEPLCDVHFFATYRGSSVPTAPGNVHLHQDISVPALSLFVYLSRGRSIAQRAGKVDPHIVLADPYSLPAAFATKKLTGAKVVLDIRTLPVEHSVARKAVATTLWTRLVKWAWNRVDGMTFISEPLRRATQDIIGSDVPRGVPVGIWESGVDRDLFAHAQMPPRGSEAPLRIEYHGTLMLNRGLESLVAATESASEAILGGIVLAIAGSGPEESEIRDIARRHPRAEVEFWGNLNAEGVVQLLSSSHAGVIPLPERREWITSSPLKLFECAAVGRPIVASNIEAHRRLLGNESFWFPFRPGDAASLTQALIELGRLDHARLSSLSESATGWIGDSHTWTRRAVELKTVFDEVMASATA